MLTPFMTVPPVYIVAVVNVPQVDVQVAKNIEVPLCVQAKYAIVPIESAWTLALPPLLSQVMTFFAAVQSDVVAQVEGHVRASCCAITALLASYSIIHPSLNASICRIFRTELAF